VAGGDERGRPGNWAASFFAAVNAISAHAIPQEEGHRAKLRNWRVSILRNRAEYLGIVEAADAEAAAAVATETFKLDGERRKRLAVRED
jgi:hypothetical protein